MQMWPNCFHQTMFLYKKNRKKNNEEEEKRMKTTLRNTVLFCHGLISFLPTEEMFHKFCTVHYSQKVSDFTHFDPRVSTTFPVISWINILKINLVCSQIAILDVWNILEYKWNQMGGKNYLWKKSIPWFFYIFFNDFSTDNIPCYFQFSWIPALLKKSMKNYLIKLIQTLMQTEYNNCASFTQPPKKFLLPALLNQANLMGEPMVLTQT